MIVATSGDDVVSTSRAFVDEIESAFANLELNDKMPTLRDAYQAFVKAMITCHDMVWQDVISHAMEQGPDTPESGSRLLHLLELPHRKGSIVTLIQKLREWTRELKQALELDRSAPPYGDQH
jgi:hypothetical protein